MRIFTDHFKLLVATVAYGFFAIAQPRRSRTISWVVGMEEIAGMVRHISDALPGSHSVSFKDISFYDYQYDTQPFTAAGSRSRLLENLFFRPILFASLVHRSEGLLYVARLGFLGLSGGARGLEFRFIKSRRRSLCCYFTGNDIRAPRLLRELESYTGVPNAASTLHLVGTTFFSDEYDEMKRRLAAEANRWADVVFTAWTDQLSYLHPPAEPFLYFHPDEEFAVDGTKFDDLRRIVVLHAASNPYLKGTAQVREAIAALRADGYEFDYVELTDVSHSAVRDALGRAHIVLNQFYAFMPGVFGIESLAARCAVLMSADPRFEHDLPPGAKDAWRITRIDQIADHLRDLLDNPHLIAPLAQAGQKWAWEFASKQASSRRLRVVLDSVIARRYRGPLGWRGETDTVLRS